MTSKLHRDHGAEATLAYRTGLSAAICKAWIEAPTEAIKAPLLADGGDQSIIIARSEIEAYALARVKNEPRGGS
jgi:hypothetical protein